MKKLLSCCCTFIFAASSGAVSFAQSSQSDSLDQIIRERQARKAAQQKMLDNAEETEKQRIRLGPGSERINGGGLKTSARVGAQHG